MFVIKIAVLLGCFTKLAFSAESTPGNCDNALGMENGAISDRQLSSSSANSSPKEARLNGGDGWEGLSDANQYVTVDLASVKTISAIAVQGHSLYNNYTKTFHLYYSVDGLVWAGYCNSRTECGGSEAEQLRGSSRRKDIVKVTLNKFKARYIAVNPQTWRGSPVLRFEIYGCDPLTSVPKTTTQITEDILKSTVWRLDGSPYVIGREIQVKPSAFLVIHAGVKVIFTSPEAGLVVNGVLKTEGAVGQRVRFSSSQIPVKRSEHGWLGIRADSGELQISHTDVLQARTGVNGPAGRVTLKSSTISLCGTGVNLVNGARIQTWVPMSETTVSNCDYGVQVSATPMLGYIQITKSNITGNKFSGLEIRDYVKFSISDCVISHNTQDGVVMDSSYTTWIAFERVTVGQNGGHGMSLNLRGNFIPQKYLLIQESKFLFNNFDGVNIKGEFGRGAKPWNILGNSFEANNKSGLNITLNAGSAGQRALFIRHNSFSGHMTSNIPLAAVITGNFRTEGSYEFERNTFNRNINGMFLKLDAQPENYDTKISQNSFQRIMSGPALELDTDGSQILFNSFTDCQSEEVLKIRRGETNIIHNNTFINPKAQYDLSLGVPFQLHRKVNASFNYWGGRQSSFVRSRVQDFYANPDLIIATISPFFTSESRKGTSVGTGDVYYVDASRFAGGLLTRNLTVRRGSLFRVGRTIRIFPNVTMTIEPGAKLLFRKLAGIYVEGALKILGSSGQMVSLQPDEPSLYPKWSGIRVHKADVQIRFSKISGAISCLQFTESLPVKVSLTNFTCIHSNTGISGPISGETTISLHNSRFMNIRNHGLYFSLGESLNFDLTMSSSELTRCQKGALTLENMGSSLKRVSANFKKIFLRDNGRGMFFYTYTNVELRFVLTDSVIQEQRGFSVNLDSRIVKMSISRTRFVENQNGLYLSMRGNGDCEDKIRIADNELTNSAQSNELQIYSYSGYGRCQLLLSRNIFQRSNPQPSGALYISSSWFSRLSIRNNQFNGIGGTAIELDAESGAQSVVVYNNSVTQCKQALALKSNDVQVEVTHNSLIQNYGSEIITLEPVFSTPSTGELLFSQNALENNGNGTMIILRTSSVSLHYNIFANPSSHLNIKMECTDCWGNDINATLNYWDAVVPREISRKLYDKRMDSSLPKIAFTPYMRDRHLQTIYSASAKFVTEGRMLGGIVGGNVTLNAQSSPYTVVSSIVIGPDDVLILEAGVTLLFYTNLAVTVEGIWQVNGEKESPVVLQPFISGSRWSGAEIIQTPEKANSSHLFYLMLKSTEYGLSIKGEIPQMNHVTSTGSTHSGMSIELADSIVRTIPRNLNISFNAGAGILLKLNEAARSRFHISGCYLANNLNGLAVFDGGNFLLSHCTVSHNSHSGVQVTDFSKGSLVIQDSEFERNRVHAVANVKTQENVKTDGQVTFEISRCVFIDHDLIESAAESKYLVSLQNTAQKSGVWKIYNNVFTKNKNMDHIVDMTFSNGDHGNHFVEIYNSSFLDNEVSVFSFKHFDLSASDLRLINNRFWNNVVNHANSTIVSLMYHHDLNAKLVVTNNTFLKNSAENVLFVSLNESSKISDCGVFEDGKISENRMVGNRVQDVVKILAYGLHFNNNTLSNPLAKCELNVPRFHTSWNLVARYNYWGHANLEDIVERICGFDMDMTRAIVDYLPYRRSESWKDVSTVTPNPFWLESVYGGQVVLDTELTEDIKVYPIKRSIYIRDGAALVVPPGLHLRFEKNRGIYVAGKLVIGRETKRTKLSALGERSWNGLVFNQRYRKAATDIRLVGGVTFREGRVEILHDGQFGTVCDDEFGERTAIVVCRMLGFDPEGKVTVYPGGHFGSGRGPILLDDLKCDGTEDSLHHCTFPGWGIQNCNHDEDVGVSCHGEYLVKDETDKVSSLENVEIADAKVAVTLKGPSVDISNCDIYDSTREGILVNSDVFSDIDLKGTVVSHSGSHGMVVKRLSGITIKNVTIQHSAGRGISVSLLSGQLALNHVTIKNSLDYGLRVTLGNEKEDHSVRISHSIFADHAKGFAVFIESKNSEKAALIEFKNNRFENNSEGSVYVTAGLFPYKSADFNNREVIVSKNVFNRSGANFIRTINNVHMTVTDNKFYDGLSKNQNDCLLNVGTDGDNGNLFTKRVNVSTNVFKGIQGRCVVKLNTGALKEDRDLVMNGEFLFNQILQSPVDSAVVVGSKSFNLSYNILDNPSADFELQVVAKGNDILHAENNWWGVSELKEASSRIYDRKQDNSLLSVNIKPMMTGHIFDCSDVSHCSGNGECVSPDRCRCNAGWEGERCDDFSCTDIDDCSDHGRCVGPNQCHCRQGWTGSSCSKPLCFGVNQCSGHGVCQQPDVCLCYPEFSGRSCSDCSEDRWGPKCLPCPDCLHGNCARNNGTCICDSNNWAGDLCDVCAPRFYGPDCRPEMHVTAIIPNGGTSDGGTIVNVWGHNFPETPLKVFYCRFGRAIVRGTWVSEDHLTCITPRSYPTDVTFEVSANGRQDFTTNELVYAYNGKCLLGSCGGYHRHGNCVFGECLCRMPWSGVNCATQLLPPDITNVPKTVLAKEGRNFTYILQLGKRSQLTSWELINTTTGLTITALNRTHAEVMWDTIPNPWTPTTIPVRVKASNPVGNDIVQFDIEIPHSYTVTVNSILPSKLLQNPGLVQVKGHVRFANQSAEPRTVNLDIQVEHHGELRPCDPVEIRVAGRQEVEQFHANCHHRHGDSGIFRLVTRHPVQEPSTKLMSYPDLRELGNWAVMGIRCTPDHVTREVYLHGNKAVLTRVTALENIGPSSVYVKFVKVTSMDSDITPDVRFSVRSSKTRQKFPISLKSKESQPIDIRITSSGPLSAKFQVMFKTLLGSITRMTLEIKVHIQKPFLGVQPTLISDKVRPGDVKFYTIALQNLGKSPMENLNTYTTPNTTISLVSFSTSADPSQPIGMLHSLASGSVTVSVTSPSSLSSYPVKGAIHLNWSSGEVVVPVQLNLTSARSLLTVTVRDELPEEKKKSMPLVNGVTMSLTNPITGYSKTLAAVSEKIIFEDLPDGHYTLSVTSDFHYSPIVEVVHVTGPTSLKVFLPRIPFTQRWTVERFGLEQKPDEIDLSSETTQVDLQVPVMQATPAVIDVLDFDEKLSNQSLDILVSNKGQITAENLRFVIPTEQGSLQLISERHFLGDVQPNSSLIVRLAVKRRQRTEREISMEGGELCGLALLYDFTAEHEVQTRSIDLTLTRGSSAHPVLPCRVLRAELGKGASFKQNRNSQTFPANQILFSPITHLSCDCMATKVKRCSMDFQPMTGCGRALSDLGMSTNTLAFVIGALDTAFTCVINVQCNKCKTLHSNIRCLTETWEFCNSTTRGQHSRVTSHLAKVLLAARKVNQFLQLITHMFGNEQIFYLRESSWFERFKRSVWDSSDGGLYLSTKELNTILNSAKLPTRGLLTGFLHRWNNTVSAWENGTILGNSNMMAYDIIQSGRRIYHREMKNAKQLGIPSIFDQFDAALKVHLWGSKQKPSSGNCATASIEVDKSDVRVGETFKVKVKLDNMEGKVIQNVKLELDFVSRDRNLKVDRDCFSIGRPSLSGIMGVDGTGRLETKILATADWTIMPRPCSTSSGRTLFYIGCRMSYQVVGCDFEQQLAPNFVTILPQDNITLDIFYNTNIFSSLTSAKQPQAVESSTLAAVVSNYGASNYSNLHLISTRFNTSNSDGQPALFRIKFARLKGANILPSFSTELGDLQPNSSVAIEWGLTTNTVVTSFNLTFTNSEVFGGAELTNISRILHHPLFHSVTAVSESNAPIPAFLVDEDSNNIPERLYSSEHPGALFSVHQWSVLDVDFDRNEHKGTKRYSILRVEVEISELGWGYVRIEGNIVTQILRGNALLIAKCMYDGRTIPTSNVWSTFHIEQKSLAHFIDNHKTSFHGNVQYELVFGPINSHYPTFTGMPSVVYVAEGRATGDILVVIATDEDDADSITYSLSQSADFTLDHLAGALRRAKPFLIGQIFQLEISATDDGIPSKTSTFPLTIIVTKDGEPPVVTTPEVVSIDHTWPTDGEVVTDTTLPNVTMTDLDERTDGKQKLIIISCVVGAILVVAGIFIFIIYKFCCKSKGKINGSPKKKGKFDKYSPEAVPMRNV